MGAFDKFERGVENAVASVFSRAFHSELKPVEITSAVKKAMDENASTMTRQRTIGPNDFTVNLSPRDRERLAQWSEDSLAEEIAGTVTAYASEQDYTLLGPIRIRFATKSELKPSSLQVEASIKKGGGRSGHVEYRIGSPDHPGRAGPLPADRVGHGDRTRFGMRHHGGRHRHIASASRTAGAPRGVIATDLGSTNGSFVEGHRITAATLVDGNTITIGRTNIMFWNSTGLA